MLASFNVMEFLIVFIRTAVCIMILPGFSMSQIPMQVRLYAAVAIAIAIYLLISPTVDVPVNPEPMQILSLIFTEAMIALALVIPVRLLFLALTFLGEILLSFIGLNPIPGIDIGDEGATNTLSALFNITAVVLFFATGLADIFVLAIAHSFTVLPPGSLPMFGEFLQKLVENLDDFFGLVLRLGAPIIIYTMLLNMIAGLVNKLTPMIPIYFVSTPFLICGGLVMFVWMADDLLLMFNLEVQRLAEDNF